ncbi:MAG: hypothetical protein JOZ82_13505 [Marmoricola sp.]|nr:hypothetical protein [Marmoricola sp.]
MSDVLSHRVTGSAQDLPPHAPRPAAPPAGSRDAPEVEQVVEVPIGRLYVAAAEIDHAAGTVQSPGVSWIPSGVVHAAEDEAERTLCGHLLTRLYPFHGLDFRRLPDGRLCRTCATAAGLDQPTAPGAD